MSQESQRKNETIQLKDKVIVLSYDDNLLKLIDIDDILKIDYANIVGEVLTFTVILNRVGLLLSEADNCLDMCKFELQIEKDSFDKEKSILERRAYIELKKTMNAPTLSQINGEVLGYPEYESMADKLKNKQLELIKAQKDRNNINTLYWSAKSKDEKLNHISTLFKPVDFEKELVEGKINNIYIKSTDLLIK